MPCNIRRGFVGKIRNNVLWQAKCQESRRTVKAHLSLSRGRPPSSVSHSKSFWNFYICIMIGGGAALQRSKRPLIINILWRKVSTKTSVNQELNETNCQMLLSCGRTPSSVSHSKLRTTQTVNQELRVSTNCQMLLSCGCLQPCSTSPCQSRPVCWIVEHFNALYRKAKCKEQKKNQTDWIL